MPTEIIILKSAEKCDVCGCKSKIEKREWGIGGGGALLVCPGEKKHPKLHEKLYEKVENFESDMHPKSYLKELRAEILKLRATFKGMPILKKI